MTNQPMLTEEGKAMYADISREVAFYFSNSICKDLCGISLDVQPLRNGMFTHFIYAVRNNWYRWATIMSRTSSIAVLDASLIGSLCFPGEECRIAANKLGDILIYRDPAVVSMLGVS